MSRNEQFGTGAGTYNPSAPPGGGNWNDKKFPHPNDAVYAAAQRSSRWEQVIQPVPEGFSGSVKDLPEGIYHVPTESLKGTSGGRVRKKSGSALERKISEEGIKRPIHVSGDNGSIVDGDHRLNAAKNLGMKTVPAMVSKSTPERMQRWHGHLFPPGHQFK